MTLSFLLVVLTAPVFRAVAVVEPNITLLAREDGNTIKLLCLLEDIYPMIYTKVMWLKDKTPFSEHPVTTTLRSTRRRYYKISEILIDAQQLNETTEYTCQASHNPENIKSTWSNYKAKFSLNINPPSAKELFIYNKAVITCVVTGESKNEVETAIVSWTVGGQTLASTVTDTVKGTTAPFTKTSTLTLEESEWFSGKEVKCSTERDKTPFSEEIKVKKGGGKPSILFYKPEKHVSETETVSLLCEISSSDLGDVYVMWRKNNERYTEGSSTVHTKANTVLSYLTVSGKEYNSAQFACAVKDPSTATGTPPEQKTTSMTKFSLKINPPSEKDLFVRNTAVITCVVTGDIKNEVEAAKVSWTVGGQTRTSSITETFKETPPFTKTSTLTLEEYEWFSGKGVKCSTERDKTPFSEEIKVKKGGKRPSTLFYKPEKRVSDSETVSLLCEVSSSDLGDVYVMWRKNNDQYMEGSSTVHINANTVLSFLTVSGRDYNDEKNVFTCAVKDANAENDITPRTDKTSTSNVPHCPACPALECDCDQ